MVFENNCQCAGNTIAWLFLNSYVGFMRTLFILTLFLLSFVFVCPSDASAQESIVRVQEMEFGEVLVRRNDAIYDAQLSSNGNISAGSNFLFISSSSEGVYRLTNAAANRPITVDVTVDQELIGGGQMFSIDNFDIDAPAQTDSLGEALIRVGARMRTNGNGENYIGGRDFLALMTLSITIL